MRMDVVLKDENINSTLAAMVILADPELHKIVLPETAEALHVHNARLVHENVGDPGVMKPQPRLASNNLHVPVIQSRVAISASLQCCNLSCAVSARAFSDSSCSAPTARPKIRKWGPLRKLSPSTKLTKTLRSAKSLAEGPVHIRKVDGTPGPQN